MVLISVHFSFDRCSVVNFLDLDCHGYYLQLECQCYSGNQMCYSGNHCQVVKEACVFGFVCKYRWVFAPHMSKDKFYKVRRPLPLYKSLIRPILEHASIQGVDGVVTTHHEWPFNYSDINFSQNCFQCVCITYIANLYVCALCTTQFGKK